MQRNGRACQVQACVAVQRACWGSDGAPRGVHDAEKRGCDGVGRAGAILKLEMMVVQAARDEGLGIIAGLLSRTTSMSHRTSA